MARPIWTGSISFGLVNVPVKLYSAVRQHDLQFNQFDSHGDRIRYKRVSERTGREVDYGDIVKGYEVAKGKYVMVDPEELEAFEPRATRTVDIGDFVDLAQIEPIYYEHTYYLVPAEKRGGAGKAYRLLLEAMERQGKVGIGSVVMRGKQYLAAIWPFHGVLAMSTMLFADEVVSPDELGEMPAIRAKVSDREVKMAEQIISSLTTEWDPNRYRDTYRERVEDYLMKRSKGDAVEIEPAPAEQSKVSDLMAALEQSLAAVRTKRRSGSSRSVSSKSGSSKPAAGKRGSAPRKRAPKKRSTASRPSRKSA
jgi:DNA end-binding protein Ku